LLQSLTSWALLTASVTEVSSKFVKFGDAYKALKRSYTALGVNMSNLEDIPAKVRAILETSLVLEPSQESLDKFLPQIGDSVADLMQMLKEKQNEVNEVEIARKNGTLSSSSSVSSFKQPNLKAPTPTISISENQVVVSDPLHRTPSKDAITRLQNNTNLMRRASKRFSAYQTSSIISMQSPNSFNTSNLPKSQNLENAVPNITAEDLENAKNSSGLFDIDETSADDTQTNSTKPQETNPETKSTASTHSMVTEKKVLSDTAKALSGDSTRESSNSTETVFLKIKDQVKKVEISTPVTVPSIKILFTQKFNYSPPGISPFPKIYIQDTVSSVSYELEDINDVKPGCVLTLQQPDIQSAILKHVDDQIANVKNGIINMEDRILKKIENIQITSPTNSRAVSTSNFRQSKDLEFEKNMKKKIEQNNQQQKIIDELQDEINRIKQHQNNTVKRLTKMITKTVGSIEKLQESGMMPTNMSENEYVKECKSKVSDGCEALVEKLDDLQDVIEFMKKDITKHNIKPSDKQLDHISKEMKRTKEDLQKLTSYTQSERKNLALVWHKQMATIASDQKFFKAQEEIMGLLEQDYQSAQETFELIVSCANQLEKGSLMSRSKLPVPNPGVSPWDASRLVMAEVEAVTPNHEERLEAIMKAERVRDMERELRLKDEFQEELGAFVSDDKLKSTGGIDEIEKMRAEKDLEHRKNTLGII
jgi:hypothetical protein